MPGWPQFLKVAKEKSRFWMLPPAEVGILEVCEKRRYGQE